MSGSLSTAVDNSVDGPFDATAEQAALDLWTRAIERLRGRLSRHTFQTYFEPVRPVSLIGDELTLAHSSKRSEEHTSELQSRFDLVCRLLLEKKKNKNIK